MASTNKGEVFRQKLIKVIAKFGSTVQRNRDSYLDIYGTGHAGSSVKMKVIDIDTVTSRFTQITQFFDVGGVNQFDPGMVQIIYPGPGGLQDPNVAVKPVIDEGDELVFDGFVHRVTREKPLPISDVVVFHHITCVIIRPVS